MHTSLFLSLMKSMQDHGIEFDKQSHIPEEPYEVGNPVLSVSQSKITYEGGDLIQFFIRKFQMAIPDYFPLKENNEISFWAQVAQ